MGKKTKTLIICASFRHLVREVNSGYVTLDDLSTGLIYMRCRHSHLLNPSVPIQENTNIVAGLVLSAERDGRARFHNYLNPKPYLDLFELLTSNGLHATISRDSVNCNSIPADSANILFGHATNIKWID